MNPAPPEKPNPAPAVTPAAPVKQPVTEKGALRNRVWQRFVLAVFRAATGAIQRMNRSRALRLGASLGRLGYRIDKRRRGYALKNLHLAYGDSLTLSEREALARRVFERWGESTIDFLRIPGLSPEESARLVTAVEGREHLDAVRADGRGFVVVTGHLGNFEFLGRWMAGLGVPSTAIVREPSDPAFAAYVRKMREYGGNETLNRGTSPRELLSRLRAGRVVTLGIDQNATEAFIPFFGVPVGTVTGPAVLALRTGVALLPAFCVREPDNSYRVIFGEPIEPNAANDKESEILRLTVAASDALETVVRRYPDQWLWLHNRWKSAFEEAARARWPEGYDYDAAWARWS